MIKPLIAIGFCALPAALAAQAMPASAYLMKAGASDLFERQSAKVMTTSHDAKVRGFAAMMTKDHTASTADVKRAAMRSGLHPAPPKLTAQQSRDLAALGAARGTARDRLYVDQQKAAHREALTVQQGYADRGSVPALKAAAGKIVPVVQHHIDMLNAM